MSSSCTDSPEDDGEEAVMATSEPERQAETSVAEAGSGSEPAAPPPRVTLMASRVRTKEAPEGPGTERGSPVVVVVVVVFVVFVVFVVVVVVVFVVVVVGLFEEAESRERERERVREEEES